jgi:hypothetical protein
MALNGSYATFRPIKLEFLTNHGIMTIVMGSEVQRYEKLL